MIHMKDKDLQSVLIDLIEEFKTIIENNDKRIYCMEIELNRLVTKINNNEALILASELGDLYINYIFEPQYSDLRGKPQTWSMFTNKITRLEEDIRREELERTLKRGSVMKNDEVERKLAKVYDSIQKHFKVNIRDLRSLKRDWAAVVHLPKRTVEEQTALLNQARNTEIHADFEYKNVFYDIIKELDAFDGKTHRVPS